MTLPNPRSVSPRAERQDVPLHDFRTLFEREFSYVWNTLRRLGVREPDLEDVTHDVFLQVHRRFADFDQTRPLRPWLFGFAFRVASDHRRLARHRHEVRDDQAVALDPSAPADEQIARAQRHTLLSEALELVELDRRAVLVLHDIDGVAIPEIAESLAIPVNTAYSRLRLAREELAAAVKRLHARRGAR